jgi:hypothetical protein
MPLPVIADVYRCALNWSEGGPDVAHNVIHLRALATDVDGVFSALDETVTHDMWRPAPSDFVISSVTITKLDGTGLGFVFPTDGTAKWQGNGGTQWIPNEAAIVTLRTNIGGRRGRGRVYIPCSEDNVANGRITSATTTALQSNWEAFVLALDEATVPAALVVASYTHHDDHLVNRVTAQPIAGSQRRRLDAIRRSG